MFFRRKGFVGKIDLLKKFVFLKFDDSMKSNFNWQSRNVEVCILMKVRSWLFLKELFGLILKL